MDLVNISKAPTPPRQVLLAEALGLFNGASRQEVRDAFDEGDVDGMAVYKNPVPGDVTEVKFVAAFTGVGYTPMELHLQKAHRGEAVEIPATLLDGDVSNHKWNLIVYVVKDAVIVDTGAAGDEVVEDGEPAGYNRPPV